MKSSSESALPLAYGWGLLEESIGKCKGKTGFDGIIGRRGAVEPFWIAVR